MLHVEQSVSVSRETFITMIRVFTSKTQQLGEIGEDLAIVFLMKQGFSIVERNFYSRKGEIDIVAQKEGQYYFFEVKAAKQGGWFNPAENLTKKKLEKFLKAVQYYVFTHHSKDYVVQAIVVYVPRVTAGEAVIEILDIS